MVSLFKNSAHDEHEEETDGSGEDTEFEDDDDELPWLNDIEGEYHTFDEDWEEQGDDSEDQLNAVFDEIGIWKTSGIQKMPCFSHLTQLLIKDALTSVPRARELLQEINKVKAYFHRCPYWYDKFKKLSKEALVEQAATRWSSTYATLLRMTKVSSNINLRTQAKIIIQNHKHAGVFSFTTLSSSTFVCSQSNSLNLIVGECSGCHE
jgi:hypothetical protein